jgi:hypothetical protein
LDVLSGNPRQIICREYVKDLRFRIKKDVYSEIIKVNLKAKFILEHAMKAEN